MLGGWLLVSPDDDDALVRGVDLDSLILLLS